MTSSTLAGTRGPRVFVKAERDNRIGRPFNGMAAGKISRKQLGIICTVGMIICMLITLYPDTALAEDLDCMLCHQYFGLSAFSDEGKYQIHYINESLNKRGPHGILACKDCHEGIKEVPHKKVKKVDCGKQCHVEEPSQRRKYSHKPVADLLKKSAHSKYRKDGSLKKFASDYPLCRDCHEQPLYRTLAIADTGHQSLSSRAISRCKSCHETEFSQKFFLHVATRMQRQTNPIDRIEVCAACHSEKNMIRRHNMSDSVSTYKETFHYKKLKLGSERSPDCVDCHVEHGANGHLIGSHKETDSPTHPDNKARTCKQSGCHENAGDKIAGFQTHVTYEISKYPLQYFLLMFFKIVMTVVLYGFLAMVFLELLRRLFPKIQLKRDHSPGGNPYES